MSLAETPQPPAEYYVASSRTLIAENVRAMMARRNMRQTKLAVALGTSQPWVSRRVAGLAAFTTDELIRIAQVLDCDLADLLVGVRSRCFPALTLVENPDQLELPLDAPDRPVLQLVETGGR